MPGKRKTKTASEVTRVAIYARRSSDLQNDVSTERQIRECRERAAEFGWQVVEECIFTDEAKTGETIAGRDGLDALMRLAEGDDPPFSGILIADTSRFGRHLVDILQMQEILEYYEIFLYFVDDELDSRDKGFRRRFIDNGQRDEDYVRSVAKKVHNGQRDRFLQRRLPGGRVYGYDNVPVENPFKKGAYGRPLVDYVDLRPNPFESAVVRRIFEMYRRGMGHRSIAKTLNDERVPSPLQNTDSPIKRLWNAWSVADILKRDKYRSVHVWKKTKTIRNPKTKRKEQVARPESEWESVDVPEWRIVSDELWNAVRAENKRRQGPSWWKNGGLNLTAASRRYLLSGLMRCGVCGGNFGVVEGRGLAARYGCIGHRFRGTCANKLTILQRVLDPRLTAALAENLQDPTFRTQLAEEFHQQVVMAWDHRNQKVAQMTASRPQLQERERELQNQADNIAHSLSIARGSVTLIDRLQSIEAELKQVQEMLLVPEEPESAPLPVAEIEEFLMRKTADVAALLTGDPELTKLELRKRVEKLVMQPMVTSEGPVYEVSGDLRLFAAEEDVECVPSVHGSSALYTSAVLPFRAVIPTKHPKLRKEAA
jgi:site-specific DNA recombinase